MAHLKYIGGSHFRQLFPADLSKVGVEIEQALTFARHEVVKVRDDLAEAIHKLVGDEFEKVDGDIKGEVRDLEKDPQPTSAVPGQFVPQVAPAEATDAAVQPMPAPQATEAGNTPAEPEPVPQTMDQTREQPTPSEQPPSEVEGPGASA